jgi:hypothetical protein
VDGQQSFPPLKTHAPKSASDELGDRIERNVEEMITRSLSPGTRASREKSKIQVDTLRYTISGLVQLLLVVLTIVIIIWLVKTFVF